jgi:UrcA family protein
MIKIPTALGAVALAASALPVAAAPVDQGRIAVSYAGLDLSNPADAARLALRLRSAAREVCGSADPRDLRLAAGVDGCQHEAIARARADVELAMRAGGIRVVAVRTN